MISKFKIQNKFQMIFMFNLLSNSSIGLCLYFFIFNLLLKDNHFCFCFIDTWHNFQLFYWKSFVLFIKYLWLVFIGWWACFCLQVIALQPYDVTTLILWTSNIKLPRRAREFIRKKFFYFFFIKISFFFVVFSFSIKRKIFFFII